MPPGAIYVGRPSQWGNPFNIADYGDARYAVDDFRAWVESCKAKDPIGYAGWLTPLIGHDLACWCPEDAPCHADVLLELVKKLEEE
jgi:hypothetical protein